MDKIHEGQKKTCPYTKKCGGCQLLRLSYDRQLDHKQAIVRNHIGRFCRVRPIIGMDDPYHYRNKVHAAFAYDSRTHRVVSGIYQASSHKIVPVESCLIEDETADAIINDIRRMMPSFKLRAYDERNGTGFLRHVLVRRGFSSGEVMVVIVAASPIFPAYRAFVRKLTELHPDIKTIVLNINDRYTSLVLGDREKVLYGSGWIEDELCGCTFRISPTSFYQINSVQTEKLYRTALDFSGLAEDETALDAYCGIGTMAMLASRRAKNVLGVELNRDAVRDAVANARRNGITNCRFTAADAGEYMADMAAAGSRPDVVFMNPPRAGSDERFLRSLIKAGPSRVVYTSCNPETLARDLAILTKGGYQAKAAQPVDMFPHTEHIETVVCLSNKNAKQQDYGMYTMVGR